MHTQTRVGRWFRWMAVIGMGVLPAFLMRCDKAALNFQRGLYQGLGDSLSEVLVEQGFLTASGQTEE